MGLVNEFLSGAHRYFPNVITITLIVVGLFLGKSNWVLVGVGGLLLASIVLILFQGPASRIFGSVPGMEMIAACSMIPTSNAAYITFPSLWISLTFFYIMFILMNASNIYTTKPTKLPAAAIPVQQRKGLGLISIVAAVIFLLTIAMSRYMTGCETIAGVLFGILLGVGAGVGWWYLLNACGADYYPDIHGVMIGLRPGNLHTSPVACTPR
jgi:hypothetical protein